MKPVDHFYSAIDCADPINLANFYSSITGLKVDLTTENTDSNIVWVELKDNQGIPKLAFKFLIPLDGLRKININSCCNRQGNRYFAKGTFINFYFATFC